MGLRCRCHLAVAMASLGECSVAEIEAQLQQAQSTTEAPDLVRLVVRALMH